MTDTNMAQTPISSQQQLVQDDLNLLQWPVLGLGFAVLCTFVWWIFLGWLLIKLFS